MLLLLQNKSIQCVPISAYSSRFNRLVPEVPNNMFNNPPFYSFVSLLVVLVTPFNKILESSIAWTIFIMPFISLFKVVVPEPSVFFWIPASVAEAAAVISNGAKTFFLKELLLSLMVLLIYSTQQYLILFFCLLSITIHEEDRFHQAFLKSFSGSCFIFGSSFQFF